MKLRVLFVCLAMLVLSVSAETYGAQKKKAKVENVKPSADQVLIEQAKASVKLDLKDPDSAQFRDVRVKQTEEGVVIGEVNSKNIYGGYSGYEKFYWGFDNTGKRSVWRESEVIELTKSLNRALGRPQDPKETPEYKRNFVDGW